MAQNRDHADTASAWNRPGVTVTDLESVPGWFARPDTPEPVPAVLLLHPAGAADRRATLTAEQTGTDHDIHLFDDLATALLNAGIAVIGFDNRFLTARRPTGWEPDHVTFPTLIHDATTLLTRLRHHPGVDPNRISLLGISLGTQIAAGAAARAGGPCRLILAAPGALTLDHHLHWTLIGRRLEWILAAGLVGRGATVDLDRLAELTTERAGWWDDFNPADFTTPATPVTYEHLAATLHHHHDRFIHDLFTTGDPNGPAEYWRSRRTNPPLAETLAAHNGPVRLHVGDEDWTTPPRQTHLLAHTTHPDLTVTIHPDLGHLLSPRDHTGRLTDGPIHPTALAALVASALD